MKTFYKKILPYLLTFEILIVSFFSYSIPAYAADFVAHDIIEAVEYGIEYKDWTPFWDFLYSTSDGLMYLYSQMGAIVNKNFQEWVNNNKALESLAETVPTPAKKDGENIVFTKEFMAELKALLEQYAKENEPYYMAYTVPFNEIDLSDFKNHKNMYDTLKNLLEDSPSGVVAFGCNANSGVMWFENVGTVFKECSLVNYNDKSRVCFYNNETWDIRLFHRFSITLATSDPAISSTKEFIEKTETKDNYGNSWSSTACRVFRLYLEPVNYSLSYSGMSDENMCLVSKERRRIRVFNTYGDFQNYTLGKRSVYYTSNYYNYVPEDLSVSIDDLQKEIDDLSKVIDQLLDQISKDTDESEIEELLRQILEALKNQQGGGGGTGGGDVNVDIDLGTTNNWLSKIYTKVSQIFDKISATVEPPMQDVVTAIENLSQMLKRYLAEITGDLDDIKGQLEDMSEQEFNDKTDSFLSQLMDLFSEISEVAKGKFPFSIPSDIQFLIARISGVSPETAASYSYDENTVSSLSFNSDISLNSVSENDGTDHGGGGSSRPGDETEPPGGGGASRPGGSGFVSVEHGGGGSGREPVSSNNWAPVFTLPIVIERYGIEEYIILDMSMFDPVSKMSRTLFLIMYIVCLYNMTFKVMGLWGDLVG